tara:strand:+ start:41 stop:256 length:216 start_codon:yes stop_codon:yes gene_type:complete
MKNCLVIGTGGRHIDILRKLNYKIYLFETNNTLSDDVIKEVHDIDTESDWKIGELKFQIKKIKSLINYDYF